MSAEQACTRQAEPAKQARAVDVLRATRRCSHNTQGFRRRPPRAGPPLPGSRSCPTRAGASSCRSARHRRSR
eukprot:4740232-Pyramimonas_sp.AAC.1